jgi:hypothetical protein
MTLVQDKKNGIRALQFTCVFLLPIICYYLSVSQGRSRPWLSIISGNYLLMPERIIFALGMVFYCALQLWHTGPFTNKVVLKSTSAHLKRYCLLLEKVMLGALVLIACVPAQEVMGLHAATGTLIVGSAQLWFNTVLFKCKTALSPSKKQGIRILMYIGYVCILGMVLSYPPGVLIDIVRAGENMQRRLHLIAWDPRWFTFAIFEWMYYYILFGSLCWISAKSNKEKTK